MGLHHKPSVMVVVVPKARKLEILTAPELSDRLSDEACDEVGRLMSGIFATGDLTLGLERGIQGLAERAGFDEDPDARDDTEDLPNIVEIPDPEAGK